MLAAGRLYSRPIRHSLRVHRSRGSCLRLGPVTAGGHVVVLRPPRFSDVEAWRSIRLRDRCLIEPFWLSSTLSWEERHSDRAWMEEVLSGRANARVGRSLSLVIEVDGAFAGQFNLERIDTGARSAEIGAWLDSTLAGRWIMRAAGQLLADHAFGSMGLRRITAPVCVDNVAAALAVRHFGMCREGTMASYLDVGGRRMPHDLWAITADTWVATAGRSSAAG
ncbi:GNAT family N-acetyltransferase [Pseudonocardia cypriaca]|uniref:GNAT family N-acetyltransferase n=1 Tax=Pseudonocardia cypriaca TaxID=882449 RepID=UPI001FE43A80|nr:GNAT family protein [Pseudonocardia cypriaca]